MRSHVRCAVFSTAVEPRLTAGDQRLTGGDRRLTSVDQARLGARLGATLA
jgi:hypothetical protein